MSKSRFYKCEMCQSKFRKNSSRHRFCGNPRDKTSCSGKRQIENVRKWNINWRKNNPDLHRKLVLEWESKNRLKVRARERELYKIRKLELKVKGH